MSKNKKVLEAKFKVGDRVCKGDYCFTVRHVFIDKTSITYASSASYIRFKEDLVQSQEEYLVSKEKTK